MKSAFQKQLKRYKYFEQYYNSKDDKEKALDLISGRKEKFNNRKKTLSKEIQSEIDDLDYWLRLASDQDNGSTLLTYYSHEMDIMLDKLSHKLHQVSVYFELDKLKELYGEKVTSFIQDAKGKEKDARGNRKELFYVNKLNRVIDTGKKYLESEINFQALSEIEEKIISEECPDSIGRSKFWDDRIPEILGEDNVLNGKSSEDERKKEPGNPQFKKNEVNIPDGFYKRAEELVDQYYPDKYDQNGIAIQLIEEFLDKDYKKKKTVKRRISDAGIW